MKIKSVNITILCNIIQRLYWGECLNGAVELWVWCARKPAWDYSRLTLDQISFTWTKWLLEHYQVVMVKIRVGGRVYQTKTLKITTALNSNQTRLKKNDVFKIASTDHRPCYENENISKTHMIYLPILLHMIYQIHYI